MLRARSGLHIAEVAENGGADEGARHVRQQELSRSGAAIDLQKPNLPPNKPSASSGPQAPCVTSSRQAGRQAGRQTDRNTDLEVGVNKKVETEELELAKALTPLIVHWSHLLSHLRTRVRRMRCMFVSTSIQNSKARACKKIHARTGARRRRGLGNPTAAKERLIRACI